MHVKPIGVIRTSFKQKENTPIQGKQSPDSIGTIVVFKEYAPGLKDIETFTHIYLLYYFHRAGDVVLVRPTFLDDTPHGVFASRHPCRPNGIGLTIVALKKRKGNTLIVSGIDVLDGTPLLDIKPYIPRFDCHRNASNGWVSHVKNRRKPKGRE
ncbi:MAG: tRNA (N6-threonylcarbamoyladenosine(37)-N6)-methyltransferase TrmO [Kiritimatiellae bacterium]|nr:tRNA (N6-threonylcarbamoyladenosine(37)-N6)-methyltransferase TrmO [Kiritimatiellia bacterium]